MTVNFKYTHNVTCNFVIKSHMCLTRIFAFLRSVKSKHLILLFRCSFSCFGFWFYEFVYTVWIFCTSRNITVAKEPRYWWSLFLPFLFYFVTPFGLETFDPSGPSARFLFENYIKKIVDRLGARAGSYLAQHFIIAIQRGTASVQGTQYPYIMLKEGFKEYNIIIC